MSFSIIVDKATWLIVYSCSLSMRLLSKFHANDGARRFTRGNQSGHSSGMSKVATMAMSTETGNPSGQ